MNSNIMESLTGYGLPYFGKRVAQSLQRTSRLSDVWVGRVLRCCPGILPGDFADVVVWLSAPSNGTVLDLFPLDSAVFLMSAHSGRGTLGLVPDKFTESLITPWVKATLKNPEFVPPVAYRSHKGLPYEWVLGTVPPEPMRVGYVGQSADRAYQWVFGSRVNSSGPPPHI